MVLRPGKGPIAMPLLASTFDSARGVRLDYDGRLEVGNGNESIRRFN